MENPFDLPPDVLRRVPLFAELAKVLSWTGGPVNWDLARQIAVSIAAGETPDAAIQHHDHDTVDEHVRLAERWLVEATGIDNLDGTRGRAATPMDWAEGASTSLRDVIDPVATKVSGAMAEHGAALGSADEAAMVTQALGQMAPMFMGIQSGTIIGNLARTVTGAHEIGFPVDEPAVVLVLPAIDRTAGAYSLDATVVRQWVALRAVATKMAYEGFPRARFFALYLDFVSSLTFDLETGIRRLQELDLSDPAGLQDAFADEGLFSHELTPQSRTAAREIASLRGIIDSIADAAVAAAAARAGDTSRVEEAFRRRGDGEGTAMLQRFIGLEGPRPGEGEGFVRAVLDTRGWDALGRLWSDPAAFPTDAERREPSLWLERAG